MKKWIAVWLALLALPAIAQTVLTRPQLYSQANTTLPDNTTNEIQPADVRSMFLNVIASALIGQFSGSTTTALSQNGGFTANDIITYDASGNAQDSGTPCCGGGGSGTVNAGTTNQIAFYSSSGTAVSGLTLGTGALAALQVAVGSAGAFVVNGGAGGTPSAINLTNATLCAVSTCVSGLGSNVATALGVAVGSSGSLVVNGGALGTPSGGTLTNATGLPISTGVSGLGTGVATALGNAPNTAGGFLTANAGLPCDTLEAHSGGTGATGSANASAWAAVISGLPTKGGCLALGTGTYTFAGVQTTTLGSGKSFTVRGAGQDATVLSWSAAGGIAPAFADSTNSFNISDLTMQTSYAGGGNAVGFSVTTGGGAPVFSNVQRVAFKGSGSGYWSAGVYSGGVNAINVVGDSFYGDGTNGTGVECQGTGASSYSVAVNVSQSNFWNLGIGTIMNSYCQGLFLTNNNYIGGVIGVFSPSAAAGTLANFIAVGNEVSLQSSYAILLQPAILDVQIIANFIGGAASSAGIDLGSPAYGNIVGNDIACTAVTASYGIALTAQHFMITGNAVRGCGQGIALLGGSANNNIQSNAYAGNTTNTVNAGSGNVVGGGSP